MHGAINTSVLSPLPHLEESWEVGLVSSQLTKQLFSPHLGTCSGEPCSAPQHHPHPPALFTTSQPSGGLLPRKSNCSPGRQAERQAAGLAMTHALSVECSLFKGLAGEEAKFKARLPGEDHLPRQNRCHLIRSWGHKAFHPVLSGILLGKAEGEA